jgi:HPt (histidine-containing phosphotransfer) domain-containing protein
MPAAKVKSGVSPAPPPAFDLAHIDAQWGIPRDEIYPIILGIFADEGMKLCADARISLAAGRRDALVRAAHTLAGAAANVGALHLATCARTLQAAAETGREKEIGQLVAQVQTAWQAVSACIAQGGPATHG